MWLLLNILIFNVWLFPFSKGEKEENEIVGGDTCPLNLLGVTSVREGEIYINWRRFSNNGHCLFAPSWSEAAVRAQIPYIWRTGCFLLPTPIPTPPRFVPAALGTLKRGGSWVAATVLRTEIYWINHSLPSNTSPGSCKPSIDWNSKIVTSHWQLRFCQCSCYLGGETKLWDFLCCHLPRIHPICFYNHFNLQWSLKWQHLTFNAVCLKLESKMYSLGFGSSVFEKHLFII